MDARKTVLSLAVWIAVASPSGSSPSGSRVESGPSVLLEVASWMASTSRPSILTRSPRIDHLFHLPLRLCPHHAGRLTVQQKGPDVNSSEYLGTFPPCWHKSWTQATLPPRRLSWPLGLYRLLLALNFPIFPQTLGSYSNTALFSLCYFRKLGCSLTIRWLCLWGQRLESSISRPQHGHIRNAVNLCPVNFSASFRT